MKNYKVIYSDFLKAYVVYNNSESCIVHGTDHVDKSIVQSECVKLNNL